MRTIESMFTDYAEQHRTLGNKAFHGLAHLLVGPLWILNDVVSVVRPKPAALAESR